jgi:AcrR family transcriptional regulator
VDAAAGLPAGSTSYSFRTRQALLDAVADRLVERDTDDVATLLVEIATSEKPDLTDLGRLLRSWADPGRRSRALARYELFLEASRNPAMSERLRAPRDAFVAFTEAAVRRAGGPKDAQLGLLLTAAFEGLLLNEITGIGDSVLDPFDALAAFARRFAR